MAKISLVNLNKSFSAGEEVIRNISLDIEEGEFLVLLGPSGCGKTTLLRLIAGLEQATSGHIVIGNKDASSISAAKRGLAMVFQSYALYPHMTVYGNIAFGLKLAKMPTNEIKDRVKSVAKILEITNLLERKPRALSGGQRQRVAIGRAIARQPVAFLFDEPLSNLDAALRVQMRLELAHLHHTLKTTMIYVTHDQMEAMTLANRIVVMNKGVIEQIGPAMELYRCPSTLFVAQFIGSPQMNIFPCRQIGGTVHSCTLSLENKTKLKLGARLKQRLGAATTCGVRPEHLSLASRADCDGRINVIEMLGDNAYLYVEVAGLGLINVRVSPEKDYKINAKVGIKFNTEHCLLFNQKGEALIDYAHKRGK